MNEHLSNAARLAPIVERVHGKGHPELTQVRELTEQLTASDDNQKRTELFARLRNVTDNYTIPGDACEAFTATYESLRSADQQHAGA